MFKAAELQIGCIQSIFLLGANDWHSYLEVFKCMQELMGEIFGKDGRSSWQKFCSKGPRMTDGQIVMTAKDVKGRIKQNMRVLQRLGGLHPYGMKLAQGSSCVDIRRCRDGNWEYRLHTMIVGDITPILDQSAYPKFKKVDSKVVDTIDSEVKV